MVLAVGVLLTAFAAGLWRLFAVRFAAGDVYPAYSTLNAGPTGARAVYDSFQRLGRPVVERNFLPLRRFSKPSDTTLVLAGAGAAVFGEDTEENFELFESLLRDGLKVVVALNPRAVPDRAPSVGPTPDPWMSGGSGPLRPRAGGGDDEETRVSAGSRWGFQFEAAVHPDKFPKEGVVVVPAAGGPVEVPQWFSTWRWAKLDPEWTALASVDGRAVIVRRDFGRGSLTLLSDTVFLSNEALWRAPDPGFLWWLFGDAPRLVFDETLHGTVSSPGVMHLLRRYRLLGFLGGGFALLALFAWRAGTSLVPVHESVLAPATQPMSGTGGLAGLTNLLRQTIPRDQLLRTCFNEWMRSPVARRRVAASTLVVVRDRVVAVESDRRSDPAADYGEIASLLAAARRGR